MAGFWIQHLVFEPYLLEDAGLGMPVCPCNLDTFSMSKISGNLLVTVASLVSSLASLVSSVAALVASVVGLLPSTSGLATSVAAPVASVIGLVACLLVCSLW